MRPATFSLCCCLLLTACSTSSMRREMDVSGTLPKLIGLGGFAPSCFMFCFVENKTTQGDVIRDEAGPESFSFQSSSENDKQPSLSKKQKAKPHMTVKPVPAPPPPAQ